MVKTLPVPVSVLFIGGTGTISASSVRLAAHQGMRVTVLNRGHNSQSRDLPEGIEWITADISDRPAFERALGERRWDAVVNFLTFNAEDASYFARLFTGRTAQYIHISTASLYHKPILQLPIVESTARLNPYVAYSREKIAAEDVLLAAFYERGFPLTIVRPSHTYDEASPPVPGGWAVFDRIANGETVVVHGDGTSLWTVTHAADLAVGLVGLIGNPRAIGESFHITSDDVYTWDQIYTLIAGALGTTAHLVHLPSAFFLAAAPEWGWSELLMGDLGHSAVFDNTKIRRFVPDFAPVNTLHRSVLRMAAWRAEHPEVARGDAESAAVLERVVSGYAPAKAVFEGLNPDS
ncbi:NAD-dependent epimerase/dehydratase family protein [Mycetocola saprophilus]|uniref:NAD-dependent epimerase/dehydratase family protein n=1 Tax=Mycetocola saprophilus TaxID=76636 RepID=UPI0004BE5A52|nr:NAD-dependent epimerase/dehydratase family protein [Mycetocola saprophilus]